MTSGYETTRCEPETTTTETLRTRAKPLSQPCELIGELVPRVAVALGAARCVKREGLRETSVGLQGIAVFDVPGRVVGAAQEEQVAVPSRRLLVILEEAQSKTRALAKTLDQVEVGRDRLRAPTTAAEQEFGPDPEAQLFDAEEER